MISRGVHHSMRSALGAALESAVVKNKAMTTVRIISRTL
jgi:hypothetical protein